MDSHKRIEEFDATQIETEEIGEPDRSEEWLLVSVCEAEPSSIPYISFPKMHDISEGVHSLLDKASMKQDEPGTFSEREQESGRNIEDKHERLSLHEQHREIEGATGGVSISMSQLEQNQENAKIRKENEALHELEQKNVRRKREIIDSLQDVAQNNESLKKQMAEALKVSSQLRSESGKLRAKMVEAFQNMPKLDSENEKLCIKVVQAYKNVLKCDQDSERLRNEVFACQFDPENERLTGEAVEALRNEAQNNQSCERLSRERAEVPKDSSQFDQENEWVRREMIEALQEVPPPAPRQESMARETVKASSQYDPDDEWVRREMIEALQEVPPPVPSHERLSREIAEASKDASQHDSEWVRREMIEALQDASHYQRENESVRKEIVEAKQVVTQYEEKNERVRKEIAEAMQDASQYDQEKGRVKEISEVMPDVSHYKEENESVAIRIEAKNVRFIRNLQTEESESSARHEHNSEPLICSAATSTFQEPDKLFQEANNTEQDDTNSQSTVSSKLQIQATECVSSTTATGNAAVNYDFMTQCFKSFSFIDTVLASIDTTPNLSEKISDTIPNLSDSDVEVLKEDSSSSDEENKETDNK